MTNESQTKADIYDENAERRTPEQLAAQTLDFLGVSGTPEQYERKKKYVADAIREAVNNEREACAVIAAQHELAHQNAALTIEKKIRARWNSLPTRLISPRRAIGQR